MKQVKIKTLVGGAVLAGMMLTGAGIAGADSLQSDQVLSETSDDFVGGDPTIALGTVCSGSTKSFDVAIRRGGNSDTNTFKDGTSITFSQTQAPVGDIAVAGYGSVQVPTGWAALPSNSTALTPANTLDITVVKSTVGSFTDTFKVQAAGTDLDNTSLTKSITVTVTGTVQLCGGDAAAAIANAWLNDSANSIHMAGCVANGTNKNNTNWRGVVISTIAHEYKGMGANVNQAEVEADVLELCTNQQLAN